MAKSRQNIILVLVPFAIVLAWMAFGAGVFSRQAETDAASPTKTQAADQLHQAADSIVTAATQRIVAAKSDEEALGRAQLSLETLRLVGMLGEFDTEPQVDKLQNALRTAARPTVVEAIIQMRFSSRLRQWDQLNDTERAAAVDRFVADVKKTDLTRGHANLLLQLANIWGDHDQTNMVSKAIADVLPTVKSTRDPKMKQIAQKLEGIARRLDLPGKPIELEGRLLDGSKFDWSSYKDKVVLIDFSASWCGPCRAEAPNVLKNYRAYHDKGFEVVSVSLDSDPRMAERCIQETGCDFPTLFSDDPNTRGWDHPMATKYGVTAIPRMVLVGRDGNVVSTSASGDVLNGLLNKLLGPPAEGGEPGDVSKSSSTTQRSQLGRRLER